MHLWGDGMSLGLVYKNGEHIFDEVCGEVPFLTYPLFEKTGVVKSAFSTRIGGVSKGCYESMNLSFDRGDDKDAVMENFQRIASAIGTNCHDMVLSRQTHTANVRVVTEEDKGKGIVRERDYTDVDGLVTNVPGICLVTSYADCVPLYFVDPIHHAVGLSHSGWRGTVGQIGRKTIEMMVQQYGSDPKDMACVIGPSICQQCYEVSEDVAVQFQKKYLPQEAEHIVTPGKSVGKYQLDLQLANYYNLIHAGIHPEHIAVADVCTCCNSDLLFSHRATKGRRGILCGMMYIKE